MPGPSGSAFSPPGGYGTGNTITLTLLGLPKLIGRFKQAQAGLYLQAQRLEMNIAREVAEVAQSLVAYDTGKTHDSIRAVRRGQTMVIADRGGDRPEVPIYLEIGTFKMAARPFMVPALDIVLSSRGLQRGVLEIGGLLPPSTRR